MNRVNFVSSSLSHLTDNLVKGLHKDKSLQKVNCFKGNIFPMMNINIEAHDNVQKRTLT